MPLYEYRCVDCGREFEELSSFEDKDNKRVCPSCSKDTIERKVSSFGISTTINPRVDTVYSPKEIDKAVGAAAEKRWESYDEKWKKHYDERRKQRQEGKELKEVLIDNKGPDGKVHPFEHLGTKKEQSFRKKYTQEYKKQITDTGKDGNKTPVVMEIK
jgi:putative FmdB family regulatory protein